MNTPTQRKVLIVEDEPIFLEMLVEKFSAEHVQVLTAANGKEAIDIATKEHPDAIVTDLTMPVMDGVEFIRHIRGQDEWGKNVFVIILSNRGDMDSIANTLDLGAHHYFVKADIDPSQVIDSVKKYIESI